MSLKTAVHARLFTLCIVLVASIISCTEMPTGVQASPPTKEVIVPHEICYIIADRVYCTTTYTAVNPTTTP